MYISLYRKYRPSTFEDMFGQEHIKTVLKRQCETGRISHAYLFCGTRGTGKTTSAKILAKAVNCENPIEGEPCGKCASCLSIDNGTASDVLELDAASNNSVDDIRDICEQVVYPPASLKKRVYIIDEVHMLSAGAYNALLKTLEEPPEHVIFILATTELQKIPPTILSRCQRFEFRRIMPEDIAACLHSVAEKEKLVLEQPAAELLAALADGSMRDGLSLLESCVNAGNGSTITLETVSKQLGVAQDKTISGILKAVSEHNALKALTLLEEYYNSAKSLSLLMENLVSSIRDILVFSQPGMKLNSLSHLTADEIKEFSKSLPSAELFYIAEVLEDTQTRLTRYPFNKRMLCELALIRLCNNRLSTSPQAMLARIASLELGTPAIKPVPLPTDSESKNAKHENTVREQITETLPAKAIDKPDTAEKQPTAHPQNAPEQKNAEEYDNLPELLEALKPNAFLYSVVSQAKVFKIGNKLLILGSPFIVGALQNEQAIAILKEALRSLEGIEYDISVKSENKSSAEDKSFINEL